MTTPVEAGVEAGRPRRSRKVAANSTAQLLTFAARACSAVGVVVLLARSGGPVALGIMQFALTLSGLLPFFYGVPTLLAREVARRPEEGRRWVETGLLLTVVLGVAFTVLLPGAALAVGASSETALALALASVGMTFDGFARVLFAAFWAWERLGLETGVTAVQEAVYLLGTAIALWQGGGPVAALAVFAGSRALGAGCAWLIVGRHLGGAPLPRAGRRTLWTTVRRCTPFAASDTWMLTNARIDAVLLGAWNGPAAVGLYQAATNLVLYFTVVPRSINRALFPRMGRAWPAHPDEFRRLRDLSLRLVALVGVPVTVGSLLLAPRTIDFLYGPEFAPVVLTYQLLVLVIPMRMLGNTLSLSLAAVDRQNGRTAAVTVVAVVNVLVNCWAIPRWSYVGAAVTSMLCEALLLGAYAVLLRRATGPSQLLRSNAWPLLASAPMAAVLVATAGRPLPVTVAAGAVVYGVAVLALALLRARDRRPVRALTALVTPTR